MSEDPWLTVVGLGEDGPEGLTPASRVALEAAEIVFGPPRHLQLIPELQAETREWPVPFRDGLPMLDELVGRRVVVLASGDPFWYGAGAVLARRYGATALKTLPAPSTFSLVAARMGWPLEDTLCLGLHAAPLARLRPHLAAGQKAVVLLRDGDAVAELAGYLEGLGFGATELTVLEAVGGPRERRTVASASDLPPSSFRHPVAVALDIAGNGPALPRTPGLPDETFDHDGQLTKRHIRALTLSALAPRPGEHLWDIGGGAGSVSIEWCMAHPSTSATAIERVDARADRVAANATALGVDRVTVVRGAAPAALTDLPPPNAVFVGGGLDTALIDHLAATVPSGTRLVANAVTLESEAVLAAAHGKLGGSLTRIALSTVEPIGRKHGWKAAYPVVQWSTVL